jgi:hypothetical protein
LVLAVKSQAAVAVVILKVNTTMDLQQAAVVLVIETLMEATQPQTQAAAVAVAVTRPVSVMQAEAAVQALLL